MENENDLALLLEPVETEAPPPPPAPAPHREDLPFQTGPSDHSLPTEAASEPPTTASETPLESLALPIEAPEEIALAEPSSAEPTGESPAETVEATPGAHTGRANGSVLRYAVRLGGVLLGAFALLLLTITAMDGIGALLETGAGTVAVGEVFGEVAMVSAVVSQNTNDTAESAPQMSSPPANEHENAAEETATPSPPPTQTEGDGTVAIVSADLSGDGSTILNETPYEVTTTPSSPRAIPTLDSLYAAYGEDAPVVLILHTHGTESYAENGAAHTTEEAYRSHDPEENVLAVGRTLAETLRARGINVLFCEEMFDAEDYTMAYYNASLAIRRYLEQYPSISYIFDLHRDSIPRGEGETVRPVTEIDGVDCAQVMFVVGTDHGGSGHTGWADNFNLACRIQARVGETSPSLMRPLNLRSASFNQQYTKGSLLLELGAVGSSLEEACASVKLLGEAIAEEIIGDAVPSQAVRNELRAQ